MKSSATRFFKSLSFASVLVSVAACTSVGKPYPFPQNDAPSAELQVQGSSIYLLATNEKDCYVGKTHVDGKPGAMPVRVAPDKPLIVSYEENVCMLTATFTPRSGAHYRLIAGEGPKPSDPNASFFQSLGDANLRQCVVGVVEIDGDGQPIGPVKLKALKPRQTGLTCIKFR